MQVQTISQQIFILLFIFLFFCPIEFLCNSRGHGNAAYVAELIPLTIYSVHLIYTIVMMKWAAGIIPRKVSQRVSKRKPQAAPALGSRMPLRAYMKESGQT